MGAGGPLGFGDAIPDGTVVALDPLFPRGVAPGGARAQRLAIGADGVLVFDGEVPASVDAVPASPAIAACWADVRLTPPTPCTWPRGRLAARHLARWHAARLWAATPPNSASGPDPASATWLTAVLQVEPRYAVSRLGPGGADDPGGPRGHPGVDAPLPLPGTARREHWRAWPVAPRSSRGGVWGPATRPGWATKDADGIPAALDNCAQLPNPDQADQDGMAWAISATSPGPQDAVNPEEEICPGRLRRQPRRPGLLHRRIRSRSRRRGVRPDDNRPMTPNPRSGDLDYDGVWGCKKGDDQDGDDVLDRRRSAPGVTPDQP
ncbi:MAG: hypothetical protein R3F43_00655 [bacterium]